MSILASQTNFILCNSTKFNIEVTICTEQCEEFRMIYSDNVVSVENDKKESGDVLSWMVEGLMNTFTGTKMHQIKIQLPTKCEVPICLRCSSTLTFFTNVASVEKCKKGSFDLGPEYYGGDVHITWKSNIGYGFDERGKVAIGGTVPTTREVAIHCMIKDGKGNKITLPKMTPTVCTVLFNQ